MSLHVLDWFLITRLLVIQWGQVIASLRELGEWYDAFEEWTLFLLLLLSMLPLSVFCFSFGSRVIAVPVTLIVHRACKVKRLEKVGVQTRLITAYTLLLGAIHSIHKHFAVFSKFIEHFIMLFLLFNITFYFINLI